MIIIEGPDLVGKTTLAHELVRKAAQWEYPLIYQHFSKLPHSWDYVRSYLPYITKYAVMDRFHLSELVYGDCCRERTNISPEMLRLLEAHLALVGTYTVVITASKEVIDEQWGKRDEMFKLEQVHRVNSRFIDMINGDVEHYGNACIDLHYHMEHAAEWPSTAIAGKIMNEWGSRMFQVNLWTHNDGSRRY